MSDPTTPAGPTRPPTAIPPGRPLPPPGAPGRRLLQIAGVAAALMLCVAGSADAAVGAASAMPYSNFLNTFRTSLTGEIPMLISIIAFVCGIGGWIVGGELSGMMMYVMRASCGAAMILGAVVFLGSIGVGGALVPLPPMAGIA